ncbi:MAG: GNAT family N-acetyltransferase [Reichenbachiella sp.]
MNNTSQLNNSIVYKTEKSINGFEALVQKALGKIPFTGHSFRMRKVIPKDNEYVKELIHKILLERGGIGIESLYYDKELINIADYYQLPMHRFNVLIHKKEIVGTVGIGPSTHHSFDPKITCEVKKLYLHKDNRNQGQGKSMFNSALKQAEEMGYEQCIVKIEKREEQFLYFLLKEGFEQVLEKDDDNFSYDLVLCKTFR